MSSASTRDVEKVRHRRALIAADVAHARLQERLGDGKNAFAAKKTAPSPSRRASTSVLKERSIKSLTGPSRRAVIPALNGESSNPQLRESKRKRGGYWIARSSRAMTLDRFFDFCKSYHIRSQI